MNSAALHLHEVERLAVVSALHLQDADAPPALKALVRSAARLTGCPMAALTLVDAHQVVALAQVGLERRHFGRAEAPCDQVVRGAAPLTLLRDADGDARPAWRFYAGWPLRVDGQCVGALCVLDTEPRIAGPSPLLDQLADLAQAAEALLQGQMAARHFRKQEARIRTASLTATDWMWETDADGRITWVSAGLMQHTGLDPVAEIGLQARDIYRPRDDETRASWEQYRAARARREPFRDAIAERHTPRGPLTVSISGTPVFSSDGVFMGYRGASRNITRELALEQQARRHDLLLRQALDAIQGGVMISDAEGRLLLANRRWREHTGIHDLSTAPSWPRLVRQLINDGLYPDARGREDDFFEWRMQATDRQHPVPMRLRDAVVLARDHRLPDGCTLHFSTDITEAQHEAVTLQEVLQADHSLGLFVIEASAPTRVCVYANAGAEAMLGQAHHELLAQPLEAILARLNLDVGVQQRVRHAVDERRACVTLLPVGGGPAGPRTLELRLTPLSHQDNRAVHVMALLQDVTERQTATEKLRVSEELYRSVAATISDGLLVVQLDGRLVAINPAGARILGMDRDETTARQGQPVTIGLLHTDLQSALPPADWPWTQVVQSGQRLSNQVYPVRRPDGSIAWIQLSCHTLDVGDAGLPFAVVATFRDITQEREAAQALARSEERWKFALEGAGDGVWDWEMGKGVFFHGDRWKCMLGFAADAPDSEVGDWVDRIHPDERDSAREAFFAYCRHGDGIFAIELRVRHRLGHDIWVLSRGKVVRRDEHDRPQRVVGTISDITRLKDAERVLHEKQSAESASRAKSEFLSRMSHEIRTPLNAVRGFAQLLDQRLDLGDLPDVGDYVRQILVSSELLSDLVDDVLDLQRIENGGLSLAREAVALHEVATMCMTMLEPMARRYRVRLSCHVDPVWRVQADRRRLAQVLSNLLSNAIKYNRPDGVVRIDVNPGAAQTVLLSVEDTGMGMDAEQLGRLFQPFERLGRDTSPIEGTGLGLIITQSLVEAMGGELMLRSQPGLGTRAVVTLPDASAAVGGAALGDPSAQAEPPTLEAVLAVSTNPPPAAGTPSPTCAQACTPERPLRVMYVEDNRINALLFEEALRPYAELALEIAEDGQSALTVAQRHQPDVLVIDAHLPGMTGFEVLRALRTVPGQAHTPAYMCSADALPEDIAKATREGFVGYWTKPIDILAVTSELCRLAQLGRADR